MYSQNTVVVFCAIVMYRKFITVSRLPDHNDRLKSIKHLTRSLPECHFETLRYLVRHLKVISDHCDKNKVSSLSIATVNTELSGGECIQKKYY